MSDDPIIKALAIITESGGTDGAHHKQWVLDQVVRALTSCPTVTKKAKDSWGNPYTYEAQGESDAYHAWVRDFENGRDGPQTYEWDEGIAP